MSVRVGLVVPHIFMQQAILPHVIFSPGKLALDLSEGLRRLGADITLLTPGHVDTTVLNITADLSYFDQELAGRGDGYLDLLKKHPFTFITLARQLQSELVSTAYKMANDGKFDVLHIYTNEEDIALPFARFCTRPVVFTHHDPFNFLVKYKNVFPKYKHLNWLSMSNTQRSGMPPDTHWIGNIYHGIDPAKFQPRYDSANHIGRKYIAYLGRIIEAKGVHLAIAAIRKHNASRPDMPLALRIAGKHYTTKGDNYWKQMIAPQIDGDIIRYEGFINSDTAKQEFLQNATALIVPSTFAEPFGMVMIEALACGTPLVGLESGAIPEVIRQGHTGLLVRKSTAEFEMIAGLATALAEIDQIDRRDCREDFENRFTLRQMCQQHLDIYTSLSGQFKSIGRPSQP